jgi:iron complex outermembrane receptor protein
MMRNGDWLSRNPDLGMTIGLPDSKMGAFVVNAEYPLSEITTCMLLAM